MSNAKNRRAVGNAEFIALMAACMSIVAISIDAMLPALTIIGRDLNASYANQPQLVISAIFAGMAIGQLICGPLSDALGRKRLLYFSLLVYLAGTLLCFIAESMPMLIAGRFIQGLGVAGPHVSTLSIVRDRFSGNAMARVMSLVIMIFIMVPVIAPALGQLVLFVASWRAIFLLYLVYSLAVLSWMAWRIPETLPVSRRIPFSLRNIIGGAKEVLGHRATRAYILCAGFAFGSLIAYLTSCLQIFHELFQVGDWFAVYFGGLAMTLGVSSLVNSRLVERHGMRFICGRALLAIVISSALFLLSQVFLPPQIGFFMIFAAIQFFCFGLVFGNINALAMEPMGHIAGTASAIVGSISSIISMTAGTIIGQLYDGTLLPFLGGFTVLGLIALFFFHMSGSPASHLAATIREEEQQAETQ